MPRNFLTGYFGALLPHQSDPLLWGPFLKVSILDPSWSPDDPIKLVASDVAALIDTGAQNSGIDVGLAHKLALTSPTSGTLVHQGKESATRAYELKIYLPSIKKGYGLLVAESPLKVTTTFDLILGWDFLQHFEIRISRKDDMVSLRRAGK
jgi:hypothetical protein